MHGQLGIRLLFEELVVVEMVVAWNKAKRKGDEKAEGEIGKGEKSCDEVLVLGIPG